MVNGKNIKTHCLARKLDHKFYRPFEILEVVSPMALRLRLLKTWKIHPVFQVSLIEPLIKGNWDVNVEDIPKNLTQLKMPLNLMSIKLWIGWKKMETFSIWVSGRIG
jgi:hypothetical protein